MSVKILSNQFNRRQFLRSAGIVGTIALLPGFNSIASILKDADIPLIGNGVFYVDGKPVFLIAGSMDYFRIPAELWRARLLQAKRGGLNCIASYIAWNFHELEDGEFNFTGNRDLGRFIDICGELGLYFFARVGPFICDEWEGGGHPAWLIGKDDMQFRADHLPTLKYVRRWFEHLMPVIAKRQVTKGGPVILVQQENEYFFFNRADGKDYQITLVRWMRELEIDVTISDCNGFENRIAGSLQTMNGEGLGGAERFRKDRPDLPVLISEHYTDYMDCWGWPDTAYPATDQVEQQSMEMLSARVMYSYFMYNAGTNFGFMAATTWKTDDSFTTTTYYATAPLAEGGALNKMFFATKAADMLGMNFQEFFCLSKMVDSPLKSEGPVKISALQSTNGTMLFVLPANPTNVGQYYSGDGQLPIRWSTEQRPLEEIRNQQGVIILPNGERLKLAEGSANPIMIPFGYQVSVGIKIDWANSTLMGIAGSSQKPVLVFRGDALRQGLVSINGKKIKFKFGHKEPSVQESNAIQILGLSRELANNAWFVDGRLLIGPAYVGEKNGDKHECWFNEKVTAVQVIDKDGSFRKLFVHTTLPQTNKLHLKSWRSYIFPEINGGGDGWKNISGVRSLEQLGAYYGYAWYRASYHSNKAITTTLQFTLASDRFHVFLNGKTFGVWGRGEKATRGPLSIDLAEGDNDFIFLCDNMGRSSEGRANDRKGILGPVVIGSHQIELGQPEQFSPATPPSENYEFTTYHSFSGHGSAGWARDTTSGIGLTGYVWNLTHAPNERFILGLHGVAQYVWILVNGEIIGEHGGDLSLINGFSSKEFLLPVIEKEGSVRIELIVFGKELKKLNEHIFLFSYSGESELTNWQFKLWEKPQVEGEPITGNPMWWECDVPEPSIPGPLFLYPENLSKGQAFLNGEATGRYWEIGPQKTLYLPEPWWKEQNKLAIFDEEGRQPDAVFIERDSRAPINMQII